MAPPNTNPLNDLPNGVAATPPGMQMPPAVVAAADAEDKPDCKRPALVRMEPGWRLFELFEGGTPAMFAAGEEVLQTEGDERPEERTARHRRAVFTDYTLSTIAAHVAKPFATEVVLENLPKELEYLGGDADGCGKSMTVLARDMLQDGMRRGLVHVLADLPPGSGETQADVLRRRPRLVHIAAPCLLGGDVSVDENGDEIVTNVRIKQKRTEPRGRFGLREHEVVLEIQAETDAGDRAEAIEWRKLENGDWVSSDPRPYLGQGARPRRNVPMATVYCGEQIGLWEARAPYAAMAELNLAFYQSDADQTATLAFGRLHTVWTAGAGTDDSPAAAAAAAAGSSGASLSPAVKIGPRRRIRLPRDAQIGILEIGGAALAAGREHLIDLERRMERLGSAQISDQVGGVTATSRTLDDKRDTSNLKAWLTRLEKALEAAIRAIGEWIGVAVPENFRVRVPRNWSDIADKDANIGHLYLALDKGLITPVIVVRALQHYGILAQDLDPDEVVEEAARLKEESLQRQMDAMASSIERERAGGVDEGDGNDPAKKKAQAGKPPIQKGAGQPPALADAGR